MAKKDTTAGETANEEVLETTSDESVEEIAPAKDVLGRWALKGGNGKFVSIDGLWVSADDAARFDREADASEFNLRECEGLYTAVKI